MARALSKLALFTLILALSVDGPALAQERLFLYRSGYNTLTEVETEDSNLGRTRRVIELSAGFWRVTSLAGGRFLALYGYSSLALFDTRTLAILQPPQWAALHNSIIAVDSDALRPRIFYRTKSEFGVLEAPSFVPKVLGPTGDLNICCGRDSLSYVAGSNMLLVTRQLSDRVAHIVAFDADTANFRGAIVLDGPPGPLLVDALSQAVHVPVGVGPYARELKVQTYDLPTFSLVNETATYPVPLNDSGGAHWTFDALRQRILRSDPGWPFTATRAWAVALDIGLRVVARVSFDRSWGFTYLMPSTVRDRALALLINSGYGGSSSGGPYRAGAFLTALNATTLEPLATVDLLGADAPFESFSATAILLSPPPPPRLLPPGISGRRVELTWRDPGDATHFLIQVGSESGRSNLGTFHVGAVTQFASEVPPGRYYVRARAVNDVGLSVPSNEVVVEVP